METVSSPLAGGQLEMGKDFLVLHPAVILG